MHVSSKTILEKLQKEVAGAAQSLEDRELFLRRIAKARLLCDLLLEESEAQAKPEMSAQEAKLMLKQSDSTELSGQVTHDPESIFDF